MSSGIRCIRCGVVFAAFAGHADTVAAFNQHPCRIDHAVRSHPSNGNPPSGGAA